MNLVQVCGHEFYCLNLIVVDLEIYFIN